MSDGTQSRAWTFVAPALETLNVGVWSWIGSPDHIRCCPVAARLFGVETSGSLDNLPLGTFVASIHPEDQARFKVLVNRSIQTGGSFTAEYRTRPDPITERWLLDLGQFEVGSAGSPPAARGVVIDITERLDRDAIDASLMTAVASQQGSALERAANQALDLHELIMTLSVESDVELRLAMRQVMLLLGREIARLLDTSAQGTVSHERGPLN